MVNNTKSKMCNVTCGVPQGSTLGPLLFLIYVNDMPKASKFNTRLLADDTVLTLSDVCEKKLSKQINSEIDKIDQWMKLNKLSLNYTKTKFMLFRSNIKNNPYKFTIEIGKHVSEQVDQIKYLGVNFDEKLTWKIHIQYRYICNRLSSGSWALLKLRNYVGIDTLKAVYYSLIYSHLQYCISTCEHASKSALDPLEKLQKRIVKIITSSPFRAHTTPLYKQLNILKLNDIFKLEIAKNMFHYNKKSNKETTEHPQITTIKQLHHHNTRLSSRNNYFLPRKRTETGKQSLAFIGPKVRQEIPAHLTETDISLPVFKKKIKQHLTNNYR